MLYMYLPIVSCTPPLSLCHHELPIARVLHMFVPFLTSNWLIRVLVWFIYKTSYLHSSEAVIFFPSVSIVFSNQTFLLSLYIGPHFSSHSADIESWSSILKRFRNNAPPSIQDGSFNTKHLFFRNSINAFFFYIIWSPNITIFLRKKYILTFFIVTIF